MHFGATLRLLRIDSGLGLRDLARRLGVSGTYLSRVENGFDATPTPERLEAIAGELDVPVSLLLDTAHRLSPYVAAYVEQVPEAGTLFLDVARRKLGPAELRRVRDFLAENFPRRGAEPMPPGTSLAPLLRPERLILNLACSDLDDAFDIAAAALARDLGGASAAHLSRQLVEAERAQPSAVGAGVAVPRLVWPGLEPAAVVVSLSRPLSIQTPDGLPLRVVVVLAAGRRGREGLIRLAHVARLAARGLAPVRSPKKALQLIEELEQVG